jgi:hypothetical protein
MSMQEDGSPWMEEKVENVIRCLLIMQKSLDRPASLSEILPWGETLRDHLKGQIYAACHDLTKLLSNACASDDWSMEDREKLIQEGEAGLKLLIAKYHYHQGRN